MTYRDHIRTMAADQREYWDEKAATIEHMGGQTKTRAEWDAYVLTCRAFGLRPGVEQVELGVAA